MYDKNRITSPLKDETAKLFLEPSNELIISLLKENSAGESYKRSQIHFRNNFMKLLSSEASEEDAALARYLWWDMTHQVCLGDKSATF